MDLNVKVAVRCRPMSSREQTRGCGECIAMEGKSVTISKPAGQESQGDEDKTFSFDFCYFTDSKQDDVYKELGIPLVMQALDGFNGTIFAYGQTGSGKTFTMMGAGDMPGIIPQLNNGLFDMLDDKMASLEAEADKSGENAETKFMVTVSFLEIYNEVIKDLLNPSSKHLKIRENPELGIYVEDLCNLVVKTPGDIMSLIEQGNTVRRVAATNMNAESSRSHSCFTIKIEQMTTTQLEGGKERKKIVKAKLNLVDLAGSERASKTGASGDTLKEGANINKSLMALGTVINALAEEATKGKRHIPYRDSQLTRLLQESLGGNSATVMIAALSPADYNYDETLGTLRYANRAKNIENAVVRNEDVAEREIRNLKAEIEKLRAALESGGGGGVGGAPGADPELEAKIQAMEAQNRDAFDEKESLSKQLEQERRANVNTAITGMLSNVKEQKVEQMKKIKRLQHEKQSLTKKQAAAKKQSEAIKRSLDDGIRSYQQLQAEYEELKAAGNEDIGDLPDRMALKLSSIEEAREKWKVNRDVFKNTKKKLFQVDEEITDERAELVATAGLLEQNDALRKKIQDEERAKVKGKIEEELGEARAKMEKEREGLRSEMEMKMGGELSRLTELTVQQAASLDEQKDDIDKLKSELAELQVYSEKLEEQVTSAVVDEESAKNDADARHRLEDEVETLRTDNGRLLTAQQSMTESGNRLGQEEKYTIFKTMMDAFEKEREGMARQYGELQKLLRGATNDLAFLAGDNDRLQQELMKAVSYENNIS